MAHRRHQLRELYGFDFPDELFAFADWHASLAGEAARAFQSVLGITLHGPFDVLAGKFDGVTLRYPAVLHWRYQYDPPELFTVMVGNTDGLHWGYWFDDPGRLPPAVASYYARDTVELVEHASLGHALAAHVAWTRTGVIENRQYDPKHAASYDRDLAALDELEARRFAPRPASLRSPIAETPERMGIVVAPQQLGTWDLADEIDRDEILAFVAAEIAAGRPGTALLVGRSLWNGEKLLALDVLERAYAALDREPLRAVAAAHRAHPRIPGLDITEYRAGDYTDLADALAHPTDARTLTMHYGADLDDDWSPLVELEELNLAANRLTELPASIASCTKLAVVSLYNNELTELPPALCELPALRDLGLANNKLTTISGIERCRALVKLDLANNRLERLPDAFGELTALRSLALSRNPLGELPASIAALPALEELFLVGCLIARLPSDIGRLTKLARLDVTATLLDAAEHARVRAALPSVELVGAPVSQAKPFSIRASYNVGDTIAHPKFGVGTVRSLLADNRIEVEFHYETKTLAHRRP